MEEEEERPRRGSAEASAGGASFGDKRQSVVLGRSDEDSNQRRFTNHLQRLFQELPTIKELNMGKAAQVLTGDIVKHAQVTVGKPIYQEGDAPTACYIVLSGKVQHWKKDTQVNIPFAGNSEGGLAASKHCMALTSMLNRRAVLVEAAHIQRRASLSRWSASAVNTRRNSAIPAMPPAPRNQQPRDPGSRRSSFSGDSLESEDELAESPIQNFGVIVASNGVGSIFGDAELLVNQPRLTTAVACSETCDILTIERSDFERLLKAEISRAEIRQVGPHVQEVMTQFPFFQRLDPVVQQSVAEIMHFTYHRKKDVVFRQGDPGDLCYIILSGEVGIWVNGLKTGPADVNSRKEYGTQVARSSCGSILSTLHKIYSLSKTAADIFAGPEQEPDVPDNAGQVINLGPGKMFGELALLEDQPRTATILCNEDSAFLTIEKADFERVLKKAMNEAVMSLPLLSAPLLNELPFFQSLRPTVRQRVQHMVKYAVLQRGTVLAWQSEVPSRCYIMLSGSVSFWHQSTGSGSSSPKAPSASSFREEDEVPVTEAAYTKCGELASRLADVGRTETKVEDSKISDEVYERFGVRRKMTRTESMVEMLGQQERVLGQGNVFNDNELLTDHPCGATIVCDKDCQFLYIDRSDFDRVVKEDLMRMKVQELNMQVRRLLNGFPLFKTLTPAVQETVPEIVHYCSHPKGTVLFREGDEPDGCYIILSGEVNILKRVGEVPFSSGPQSPPAVTQADPEAYERCVQLAAKLAPVASCLRKGGNEGTVVDLTESFEGQVAVAAFGPGSLFGEMGLLNNNPRNASIYCRKDCEFLTIETSDFDRVLKWEMARAKDEKLEFLRTHVPGMGALPQRTAENLLHHFEMKKVPLNHVFIEQGEIADGSIYFVYSGSVEFYTQSCKQSEGFTLLPDSSFRRLRVLIKGGVFGAVPADVRVPFTAVARSAQCEVLHVTMTHLKQLPEPVMRGLRKIMDQTLVWATENCQLIRPFSREESQRRNPTSPPPVRVGSGIRGNSGSLPSLSRIPRLKSSKIPRPLSLKIPRPLDVKPGLSTMPRSPAHSALTSPTNGSALAKSWGGGLFQRTNNDMGSHDFLAPGETVALKAKIPQKKEMYLHVPGPHMGRSVSQPQLRRTRESPAKTGDRSPDLR